MFEPFYANYKSFTGAYNVEINGVPTSPDTATICRIRKLWKNTSNDKTRAIPEFPNPGNPHRG